MFQKAALEYLDHTGFITISWIMSIQNTALSIHMPKDNFVLARNSLIFQAL